MNKLKNVTLLTLMMFSVSVANAAEPKLSNVLARSIETNDPLWINARDRANAAYNRPEDIQKACDDGIKAKELRDTFYKLVLGDTCRNLKWEYAGYDDSKFPEVKAICTRNGRKGFGVVMTLDEKNPPYPKLYEKIKANETFDREQLAICNDYTKRANRKASQIFRTFYDQFCLRACSGANQDYNGQYEVVSGTVPQVINCVCTPTYRTTRSSN